MTPWGLFVNPMGLNPDPLTSAAPWGHSFGSCPPVTTNPAENRSRTPSTTCSTGTSGQVMGRHRRVLWHGPWCCSTILTRSRRTRRSSSGVASCVATCPGSGSLARTRSRRSLQPRALHPTTSRSRGRGVILSDDSKSSNERMPVCATIWLAVVEGIPESSLEHRHGLHQKPCLLVLQAYDDSHVVSYLPWSVVRSARRHLHI